MKQPPICVIPAPQFCNVAVFKPALHPTPPRKYSRRLPPGQIPHSHLGETKGSGGHGGTEVVGQMAGEPSRGTVGARGRGAGAGAGGVVCRGAAVSSPRALPRPRARAGGQSVMDASPGSRRGTSAEARTAGWGGSVRRGWCTGGGGSPGGGGLIRAAGGASYSGGTEVRGLEAWAKALYQFSRPHTILGTFAGVVSTSLLAWVPGASRAVVLAGTGQALAAALLMNVAIVGVNQVYDVEIDRINKPYLPLASGAMSMKEAVWTVVVAATLSLAIGAGSRSLPLLLTLGGSLALGLAYSMDLPGLRWKRSPAVAAACIMAVRSFAVHVGFFAHVRLAQGLPFAWTPTLVFAVLFMLFFSIVIAFSKDIPDVEGDRIIGIRTLSVRIGTQAVFRTCIAIMLTAYAGAVAMGAMSSTFQSRSVGVLAHSAMAALMLARAREVDVKSKDSLYSFYMFLWKLFYAEYAVLPFMR